MNRTIDLAVPAYGDVLPNDYQLTVLPWGATEPHNLHLPYMTDAILSHAISVDASRIALQNGVRCMVMPPVSYGSQNPGQRGLKFCIHARYETQRAILGDIVASLYAQGQRRLVIVNGHGGNNFRNMIRDLACDYPDFVIAATDWYSAVSPQGYFDSPGDHADEVETSVMMHYHPELVDLSTAGDGASKPFAIETLNRKVAWTPRDWSRISSDTGVGDPSLSSATKGQKFAGEVARTLAEFFVEFATKEIYL